MRQQMGVDQPNFGPLTDRMRITPGSDIADRYTQPRVEPEIAVEIGRTLHHPADLATVRAATTRAFGALEVVDSVWHDYRFTIADNTADGSSAAGFVIGPEIPIDSLNDVEVTFQLDDQAPMHGSGRDAGGDPLTGVVWLIDQLGRRGEHLDAGDVVMTGGLTAAVPLNPGSTVNASFGACGDVNVHRRATATSG